MADYKAIKGFTIQTIAGDPPAPIIGQVWYNTSSNKLKGYVSGAGAWAAGGNMNLARGENAGAGIVTAAVVFGGDAPPSTTPPGFVKETEEYNGTSWTEVNNMNQFQASMGSLGTQTAAMSISGTNPSPPNPNNTETYDGTSWADTADTLVKGSYMSCAGTTTAGIAAGGSGTATSEIWNGTSFSEGNDLNTARTGAGSAGTVSTAALAIGSTPNSGVTEEWNGTSWSEQNDLNTGREGFAASFGTTTSAIVAGGHNGPVPSRSVLTEKYDGTSWTEVADLAVAMRLGAGGGTSASAGFRADGHPGAGGYSLTSSEWADPVLAAKTVTVS